MKRFFVLAFIAVFMVAVNLKKLNVEEQLLAETIEDEALEELAEVEQNATKTDNSTAAADAKKKEEAAKLEKEKKAKEEAEKKKKDEAEKKKKEEEEKKKKDEAEKKKKEAETKAAAEKKKKDEEEKKKKDAKDKEEKAAAELRKKRAKEILEKKKKEKRAAKAREIAAAKLKALEVEKELAKKKVKKVEKVKKVKKVKKPKKAKKIIKVEPPKVVKKPLTKKDKCKALSKQAKEAAKKAKELRRKYLVNCIQKAEDNEKVQMGKIERIAKKMDMMRAKIISMIEEVKATPKHKRRPIMDKVKEALKALSDLEPEKKQLTEQAKKIGQYVVSELNEEKQRLLDELSIQQRALDAINPKIIRLKRKIKNLRSEAKSDPEAKKALLRRAKKLSFITRRAATIKSDIATLRNNINLVEARIAMKTKVRVDMEKSDLSIQLENELNKVLTLDGRFTRASDKALRTRRKKDLKKVMKVAKAIQKAKNKAAKLKTKIRAAPKLKQINLKKKLAKVKATIKAKKQALKDAKSKLKTLGKGSIVLPQSPEEIECVKLEGEIRAERRRAAIITGKIMEECRRSIEKERLRTDVEIKLLETKLGIAKQAILDLQKSFAREQNLEGLREKSKQKLYKALSAKEKKVRKQAEVEVWDLLKKINAITIQGFDAKAKALQEEAKLEEKGKQQLIKEKKDAKIKEKKLEEDLKKKEKKLVEIIEAGKKAKDKTTKEVLNKENDAAKKAIEGIKAKIAKAQKKIKALTLEIQAKTKIAEENKKLEALIKAMEQKIKKKQEDGAKELKSLVAKLTGIYNTYSGNLDKKNIELAAVEKELAAFNEKTKKSEAAISAEIKKNEKQAKSLKKEVSDKKEKLRKLEIEYSAFRASEEKRKVKEIAFAKADGDLRIAAKQKELANCQASVLALSSSITSLKMKLSQLVGSINESRNRGKQLAILFAAKTSLNSKQKDIDDQINNLRSQIQSTCGDSSNEVQCNKLNDQLAGFSIQAVDIAYQIDVQLEKFEAYLLNRAEIAVSKEKLSDVRDRLIIIKAYYGTLDVTTIVTNAVKNSELTIVASNNVFTDPMVGTLKTLVVGYRFGDSYPQLAMVKEGETLTISYLRNTRPYTPAAGSIDVFGAYFGTQDVKNQVSVSVARGDSDVRASTSTFGDPMPGTIKTLAIGYFDKSGVAKVDLAREGMKVIFWEQIPEKKSLLTYMYFNALRTWGGRVSNEQIRFLGAFWGTESKYDLVKEKVYNDQIVFMATDSVLGTTKEYYNPKTCIVSYRYGMGTPQMVVVPEGQQVSITTPPADNSDYEMHPSKVTLIRAYYGTKDVTDRIKQLYDADKDKVYRVTNDLIDNSDTRGPKTLVVQYQIPYGWQTTQVVKEGDWIIIAPDGPWLGWND